MKVDRQKLRKNCDFTCAGLVLEQPFRTKWGLIVKNWGKIAILHVLEQPFRTKWGSIVKNWRKLRFYLCWSNPFARNEGRSSKTEAKLRFYLCRTCPQPFARNEGWSSKTEAKLRFYMCWSNPFARNEGRSSKTEEKLRFYLCWSNPFARNDARCTKTEVKLRFNWWPMWPMHYVTYVFSRNVLCPLMVSAMWPWLQARGWMEQGAWKVVDSFNERHSFMLVKTGITTGISRDGPCVSTTSCWWQLKLLENNLWAA